MKIVKIETINTIIAQANNFKVAGKNKTLMNDKEDCLYSYVVLK
jgi:hypothetical protein